MEQILAIGVLILAYIFTIAPIIAAIFVSEPFDTYGELVVKGVFLLFVTVSWAFNIVFGG